VVDPRPSAPGTTTIQLAQLRVPLEDADAVFETADANGRTPIVVIPTRPLRLRFDLLGIAIGLVLVAILVVILDASFWWVLLALIGAAALTFFGAMSAFVVRVPEGTSALLVSGGRHRGVIGPGTHIIMPHIAVSHIVTRRQIPFDLPNVEAPTSDNVRARIDALLTFTITDPARFVYTIAAPDFDLVMQAAAHDGVRTILRQLTWSDVLGIGNAQAETLRTLIGAHVATYGVEIGHLNFTYARPNDAFVLSEESRQLAVAQRAEAAEQHTLAERRLQNEQALARVRLLAGLEREQERLRAQLRHAEMRQQVSTIDTDTLAARLARLEELLGTYPRAAEWEWQGEQLGVVRALASNTRAVVQLGQVSDVMRTLLAADARERAADPRNTTNNGPTA
jgi:regulator of protease activity HflC (stomatin/prohibitin superfamily)